jgi:filamentous hemagglutinin family protein
MTAIPSNRRRTLQLGTALATCIACAGSANVAIAQELPGAATVTGPAVVPSHTDTDASLRIDLHNGNSVIAWDRFGIGKGQEVNFVTTNLLGAVDTTTQVAVLNRVSTGVSNIDGSLNAQGNIRVWLANPNGIVFGNTGSFNGGSLVLTTLADGIETAFNRSNLLVPLSSQIKGTSTGAITLDPGSELIAGRDIVIVAQRISAGGATSSGEDTAMIAAQDVTFASGLGSPLSFTLNKGSTLSGLRVLGSGNIEGSNVALVAGTVNALVDHLLNVEESAQLTATDNNGTITLTAVTTGGAAQSLTKPQLETQAGLTAGAAGDVIINAGGSATVGGVIVAGRDVELTAQNGGNLIVPAQISATRDFSATANDIALGNGSAAVLQAAGRNIDITASDAAITGDAALTLRLNTTNAVGTRRIVIDAGTGGTVAFASGSKITAQGTAGNSGRAPVGIRYDSATNLVLGNVTASRLGDYTGSVQSDLTGDGNLNAGTILTDQSFTAQFGGAIKLVGVTTSAAATDVVLAAGGNLETTGLVKASRNVDLAAATTTAGATATIGGAVDAGNDYSVDAGNVKLGTGATAIQQVASGAVTITTQANGKISGAAGLALRSNRDADNANNRLILDATSSGAVDFALGSTITAGSTDAGATNAAIGVRFNRVAPGAALALGNVTGLRLGDYTGGTTIDTALTGANDFTARNVITDQAFNADFGGDIRIAALTTRNAAADVTLRAGGLVSGSQATAPAISITSARDVSVTAGTDVTMARVRGRNLSAAAGADFAPAARQDGSLTLLDADLDGNVDLAAWATGTGGDILAGKVIAGGTLTLDNSAGTQGSLKVADSLQSSGLLTLRSTQDILVARYGGSGTVGTVTSTAGAIDARADRSVLAYNAVGDAALAPFLITQAGFGAISAAGNLTVNTAAASDVAVGSLGAGGTLTLDITGNLYGRTQTTTAVPGGFFKAQTTTSVAADTILGVINLARIDSVGAVSLAANEIAVGTLVAPDATLTAPASQTYVGLRRYPGDGTVTLAGTFQDIGTVTTGNFYAAAVNLSAGDDITGSITAAAQVGTATAGGRVALQTGGIVANTVTASGADVNIGATSGTLALGTATAALDIALTKQGGSVLTAGDEVRFTILTAGNGGLDAQYGDVAIQSQTHVRGDRIDALGGNVNLSAGFDAGTGTIDQAGEITGRSGGSMRITATDLADLPLDGRIFASSGGLGDYGQLRADADISIAAGGAATPLNGAIRVADAQAGGNLYLTNRNVTAGSPSGIAFGTLRATGDIGLITSTGNGGDAVGSLIDAGGNAQLSVNDILVDTITADGNVALLANAGRIANAAGTGGSALTAGGGIAADAGLTIRVTTASATSGDVALRASGLLTAGTITAGDDVTLSGSSVRLGSATSTGIGSDATDVNFVTTTTIADPLRPGFTAQVPTIAGAPQAANAGGTVSVTATAGDVTGLAVDPLVTPTVTLITTGDRLSSAYGAANLTAQGRSGSITVSATNAAQLGTVRQGTNPSGTGTGNIAVSAQAIAAETVAANSGSATLNAGTGTLVVGTMSAFDTASLIKAGASTAAGDEIRFNALTGGAGESDPTRLALVGGERLGVNVQSATSVLGDTVLASLGDVRVTADAGGITGRTGAALAIDADAAASLQNVTLRSATAIELGDVVARDRLSVIAGATGSKAGSISVADARSLNGAIYLTAVNTLAGSPSDVTYDTLVAAGEIVAITSGSNRGDVTRVGSGSASFAIDAGTDVSIDARNLDLDSVRARLGSIALHAGTDASALGTIDATTLQAGTSVAGLAGGAISVGTVKGTAGDVALQAGGVLTVDSATASDDVLLTGTNVRIGSATTLGGDEVGDAVFSPLATVNDPSVDGVAGFVPATVGTGGVAGSSIVVTATDGDVTGLATDPLVTPGVQTVTTADQLSTAYGKANLTATDGAVSVTAAAGSAQLGTVLQQRSGDAGPVAPMSNIMVAARAISADTVTANIGSFSLDASQGTLVLGSGFASGNAFLTKHLGNATIDGDELRVIGAGVTADGGIEAISDTHVRAASFDGNGTITVRALGGDVSGIKSGFGGLTALPTITTGPRLTSAYGQLGIRARADGASVLVSAAGAAQLGTVVQGTTTSFASGLSTGAIAIDAAAISADSIDANTGSVTLGARMGTMALGTVEAGSQISITKFAGDVGVAGDEVRFDRLTGGTLGSNAFAGDVTVDSQTHVRGNRIDANGGDAIVYAGRNPLDQQTTQAGEITGLDFTPAVANALSVLASANANFAGRGNVVADAGGRVQLGTVTGDGNITVASGRPAAPLNGAIRIDSAQSGGGILLTSTNAAAGTISGISFGTLTAGGDAVAVTSGSNGGTLAGSGIAAGGSIGLTANGGDIAITNAATAQNSALFGATGNVGVASGTATSGTLGILAGGNVSSLTALVAGEDLAIQSGGMVQLGTATAGDDLTITAPGSIAIDSAVITGLGIGNTDATFGTVPALTVGAASQTGNTLALTSSAGDVSLGSLTVASTAGGTSASISASGNLVLARDVAVAGGLTVLAGGDVTLGDASTRSQSATGALSITSSGGAVRQGSGRLTLRANSDGAGSEALTLAARSTVALGNADLVGGTARQSSIAVTANTEAVAIGSATGATFTATAGTGFTATGAIATGTAALSADTTAPTVSITARNGNLVATTIEAAQPGHDVFLRASNAITLDRVTAARAIDALGTNGITANALVASGGALTVASNGAIGVGTSTSGATTTYRSGGSTIAGTLTAGGAVSVTSGGAATLTQLQSGGATTVTAQTSVRVDTLGSAGVTTIKAGSDAALGTVTSAGDATVTAGGTLTLGGAFNAAGHAVTFTARDAAIAGDVTGTTIKVVNDAGAGNTLVLGDNATGTGFALSAAELGHLKASTMLVLDAASAATKQDVSIGALSLTVPPKVLILADGRRIDVTGKIDVSGVTTALQLGGSAENAGLASILRVVAKPDGSGGSIAAPGAAVSLRAVNIAFGQDAGFLTALGVTPTGTGDPTTALTFNDRASSTLYFAGTNGGAFYTPSLAGVKLVTADTLSLSYTNFALFQNTGVQGQTSGVDIGSFLSVNATGARPILGLFGTLAGRSGTAASLLGSLAFEINLNDIRSSRINGCVVGEGAGCITTVVFSPNLASIDAVRPLLFTVASDYEVPFNPLIGTNNDALFGDVGTFGLADIPLDPIECSDPTSPQCPAQQAPQPPAAGAAAESPQAAPAAQPAPQAATQKEAQ